ncbi:MAG: hypothetical protein Q7T55_11585 [Solirubrobacteraceae bacterium]|nr:hypothetical protein [Solirubrobacteraceae bacterium]
MNEWLTLLAGPLVPIAYLRHRSAARAVHADLRTVIAAQPMTPVTDASGVPVLSLARALELDPSELPPSIAEPRPPRGSHQDSAWEARELIRPLGLELVDVVRVEPRAFAPGALVRGRTEMVGVRHGRQVHVILDDATSLITVAGDLPTFSLRACASRWNDLDAAPRVVGNWLGRLEPSRRWDGVLVESGPQGLRLQRVDGSTSSWMHDLWLAEQLADAAACRVAALA